MYWRSWWFLVSFLVLLCVMQSCWVGHALFSVDSMSAARYWAQWGTEHSGIFRVISEIPNLIAEGPPQWVRDGAPRRWMQLYLGFDFLRGQFDFIRGEVASPFFKNIFSKAAFVTHKIYGNPVSPTPDASLCCVCVFQKAEWRCWSELLCLPTSKRVLKKKVCYVSCQFENMYVPTFVIKKTYVSLRWL